MFNTTIWNWDPVTTLKRLSYVCTRLCRLKMLEEIDEMIESHIFMRKWYIVPGIRSDVLEFHQSIDDEIFSADLYVKDL